MSCRVAALSSSPPRPQVSGASTGWSRAEMFGTLGCLEGDQGARYARFPVAALAPSSVCSTWRRPSGRAARARESGVVRTGSAGRTASNFRRRRRDCATVLVWDAESGVCLGNTHAIPRSPQPAPEAQHSGRHSRDWKRVLSVIPPARPSPGFRKHPDASSPTRRRASGQVQRKMRSTSLRSKETCKARGSRIIVDENSTAAGFHHDLVRG